MNNRDRAWTAEQAAREYTSEELESHCGKLWDSQWTNVVNHDNCYAGWDKDDAINHAVKLTEQYMRANFDAFAATLRQQPTNPPEIGSKLVQGEQAGGMVSDKELFTVANTFVLNFRGSRVSQFEASSAIAAMRTAVAPLLRAPAETESKVYACPRCATSMQVDPSAKPRAPAERGGMVDEGDIEAMRGAAMEIAHNKEAWFPMTDRRLRRAAEVLVARRAALAQNAQAEAVVEVYRMGNGLGSLVYTDYGAKSDLPHGTKLYLHAERARVSDARTGVYVTHDDAVTLREIRLAQPPSLRDSAFIGRPLLAIAQRIEATMLAAALSQTEDAA